MTKETDEQAFDIAYDRYMSAVRKHHEMDSFSDKEVDDISDLLEKHLKVLVNIPVADPVRIKNKFDAASGIHFNNTDGLFAEYAIPVLAEDLARCAEKYA